MRAPDLAALALAALALGCDPAAGRPARSPAWTAPPEGVANASSGTRAERYFPLVDGYVYLYATQDESGEQGILMARVHRDGDRRGELRFPAGVKRFEYAPDGVVLADRGVYVLKEPIAPGTSWAGEHGGQARILATDATILVPAGRFTGCVQTLEERRGDRPARYVSTFCPDVGVVSLEAESGTSYERADLKSYAPPMQVGPDGVQRFEVTPPPSPHP
ncbi:MAG: hypothetical protein IT372_26515 [Polyangiaceae bacterium]|nr:hypothetical protein [Polyangiaceae bacterium]